MFKKLLTYFLSGPATPGGEAWSSTFLRAKKKKGNKAEKRKSFNAETIKIMSPWSKFYCFSHSRASRIQRIFFSTNLGGQ